MLAWCSIVDVELIKPPKSHEYALMMALAADESDFRSKITTELATLGRLPINFDDIEHFDPVTRVWEDEVAQELNDNLSANWPVQYRNFHSYPVEENDA